MSSKKILQQIFDKAAIDLATEGYLEYLNYGITKKKEIIPFKIDLNAINVEDTVTKQLDELKALGWVSVGVGTIITHMKEEKGKKMGGTPLHVPTPEISLIAIHRSINGDAEIIYSKLLRDLKGTLYPDINEVWLNKKQTKKMKNISFMSK